MAVMYEVASLPLRVGQALHTAIANLLTDEMAQLARRSARLDTPKPLSWSATLDPFGILQQIRGKVPSRENPSEVPKILARWATVLGLAETDGPPEGTVQYAGRYDGCPVEIWGVVDMDAWLRAVGR